MMAWDRLFRQPYLLLTLTTLAWAGNAVASRLAAGHISPMALTALRWVGVVALLAPFMTRPIRAAAPVLRPIWRRILVMGGLGFTAFNALMYAAAYHTTAVNIAIFQGAVPVFVLIFGLAVIGGQAFRAVPGANHFVARVLFDCVLAVSQSLFTISLFLFYWRKQGIPAPAVPAVT